MRLSKNARAQIGGRVEIKWGTSRGRDSYGYTTTTLYYNGRRMNGCNGGGYDMRGTVIGNWITQIFAEDLKKLKPEQMEKHSCWEYERAMVCRDKCESEYQAKVNDAIMADKTSEEIKAITQVKLPEDCWECPTCKGRTGPSREGKTIDQGRYFYGLRFYDPKYDVLNEKLERCDDLFTKPEDVGKTFRQLKKEGKIVDLDILRKFHSNTSTYAKTRRHLPTIDGACGESSVMRILNAIGLSLHKVHDSKKLDVYEVVRHKVSK